MRAIKARYNKNTDTSVSKERIYIMAYVKVTKDNFSEVAASEKPVLLDFYADWCGPCRMVGPIVEEIAAEHPEYVVGKVNVDEENALAAEFGVMSIPTLVVIKDGEIADTHIGLASKNKILAMLDSAK